MWKSQWFREKAGFLTGFSRRRLQNGTTPDVVDYKEGVLPHIFDTLEGAIKKSLGLNRARRGMAAAVWIRMRDFFKTSLVEIRIRIVPQTYFERPRLLLRCTWEATRNRNEFNRMNPVASSWL